MSAQDVTEEINAQSGRFEFLKQSLTLGLAGLAGIAAIFTDAAKIPTDVVVIVAVCAIGVFLLSLVGYALMGLSVYANLLKTHAENGLVDQFRKSMIRHAQGVFICIVLVALSFVAYAGLQVALRDTRPVSAAEAIGLSKKALETAGCDAAFESARLSDDAYRAIYRSRTCKRRFTVVVRANSGVVEITPSN